MAGQPPDSQRPTTIPVPPPPPNGIPFGQILSAKPTSGKAVAALCFSLGGLIGAFFCPPVGAVVLIGLVFGILGIIETGKEGKRSGRGLALAGTVIASLAVCGVIGITSLFIHGHSRDEQRIRAEMEPAIAKDQALILKRLKQYYDENDRSLGPGGPWLATRTAGSGPPGNTTAVQPGTRVSGTLELKHLVGPGELQLGDLFSAMARGPGSSRAVAGSWVLTVNGRASATLRATDWGGAVLREIEIHDIGRGDFIQTE